MSLRLILLLALPCAAAPRPEAEEPDPAPYIRLMEDEAGLRLELAVRTFVARRDGAPAATVTLVAAMHLAQGPFFRRVQALLDGHDLVLFEHVRDDLGWGPLSDLTAAERDEVLATGRRMEALLAATHAYVHRSRELPADVGGLLASGEPSSRLTRAARDAWGGPLKLNAARAEGQLRARVTSLGRDGEPGGDGVDADRELELEVSDRASPLRSLQTDVARALGWKFQLDEIDDLDARWRNSDLSIAELRAALGGGDEMARDFAAMLGGESGAVDGFLRGFLGLIGATRTGRSAMQLAVVEVLAQSERLFEEPPEEFGDLFDVLIARRNQVVCDDLVDVLREEPERRRIAVFYGAGHLNELERTLREELALSPIDTRWIPAVELSWATLAFTREEAMELRVSFRESFEESLGSR